MRVFFILSKFLSPFCSLVGIFLLSFWLLLLSFKRLSKKIWFVWGSFFYLASLPVTCEVLLKIWEPSLGDPQRVCSHTYDVIIVLGGMVEGLTQEGQWCLNANVDRLTEAVRLYRRGVASYVLVTGGTTGVFTKSTWRESQVMFDFLHASGIPAEKILVEDQALNTYENAFYSLALLKEKNLKTCLLVSSAFHMRRSLAVFRKLGINVIPYAVDSRQINVEFPLNWLPSQRAFTLLDLVLKEFIGLMAYRFMSYI